MELMGLTAQEKGTKRENNLEDLGNTSHNKENTTRGIRRRRIIEEGSEDEPSSKRRQIKEERTTFF